MSMPSRSRALLRVARTQALVLTWRWVRNRVQGVVDVWRKTEQYSFISHLI